MQLMPASLKAKTLAKIETIPAYAQLAAEWAPIREAINSHNAELRALERQISERKAETEDERVDRITAAIRAGDKSGALADSVDAMLVRATELKMLIAANRRIDGEFRTRANDLRAELSISASAAAKPAHKAAVGSVLAALDTLREAVEAEKAVRQALTEAGFECLLPDLTRDVNLGHVPGYDIAPWEGTAREYAR